jgi:uncharacterized membrane protein YvlD (DUF360 family)
MIGDKMIGFVICLVINAVVLTALPWVKYKSFGACMITCLLMSVVGWALTFFQSIANSIIAFFTWFIPFVGPALIRPVAFFFTWWIVATIALFIADQIIEEFEIATLGRTAQTALILGILNSVLSFFI